MSTVCGFMSAAWMLTYPVNYYDILGDAARLGDARNHFEADYMSFRKNDGK